MISLFFDVIYKENKAYFVEQEKNLLIEYDCVKKIVIRSLALESLGRSHLIDSLQLFNDYLILFPCWYDSIIVVDLSSFEIVNKIILPDSLKEGLPCDYIPLFFDDVTDVYMYRKNESHYLYRISHLENGNSIDVVKVEGVIPPNVSGYKNAFVFERKAFLVTSESSDNLLCYSLTDGKMSLIKIDSVMIDKVYCDKDNLWIADAYGTIYCCETDGKIIFQTVPECKDLIYKSPNYTIFGDEVGIMVAGVYMDGSLIHINKNGNQKKVVIKGFNDTNKIYDKWYELYNRMWSLSKNRGLLQDRNGYYYLGGGLQGKAYEPISIPLTTEGLGMLKESVNLGLKELLYDLNF